MVNLKTFFRGDCTITYLTSIPPDQSKHIRNGYLFMDTQRRVHLEFTSSRRAAFFELIWRNPLREILSTLHPHFRKKLFYTLRSFSRSSESKNFIAGLSFHIDPKTATLRIKEAARLMRDPQSSQAMRQLMHYEIVRWAETLKIKTIVCETFSAYGENLRKSGWQINPKGRSWVIRLGAFLNRYQCYQLVITKNTERAEPLGAQIS